MNFYNFFLLLWVIFALLDPDPDSESGSTDPIESGSESATLHRTIDISEGEAKRQTREYIDWQRLLSIMIVISAQPGENGGGGPSLFHSIFRSPLLSGPLCENFYCHNKSLIINNITNKCGPTEPDLHHVAGFGSRLTPTVELMNAAPDPWEMYRTEMNSFLQYR
jgi:hypothetical protein